MRQKTFTLLILFATLAVLATPLSAQCGNLIFRVTQGNYEQSFNGGDTIVLRPNAEGNMRVYYRTNGPTPATLAAEYGHPSKFGYRGMDPIQVRQVFRMDAQNAGGLERGNVRFTTVSPGNATLGYRIDGANDPAMYRQIPKNCLSGVLNIQVQGGGGGGQASLNPPPARNPAPSQAPGGALRVVGQYNTDFGQLNLDQDGNTVYGTYGQQGGRVNGTLRGDVLTGTWTQPPTYRPPTDAGDIKFTFEGGNFTGGWRNGSQGQWKPWNGQLVGR